MYLSRLILNPRSRRVQREIAQPYQMHRTLMNAFPDDLGSGQERALYRLEQPGRDRQLVLLVQSRMSPDWSFLTRPEARDYLLPAITPNPAVKEFRPSLSAGQSLAFRLLANPTVKRRFPNGDHKRVGIYDAEEQLAWLQRKGKQGGFELLSANLSNQGMVRSTIRRNGGETHALKLLAVRFDGVLRVTDAEALSETVGRGIGSGRDLGSACSHWPRHGSDIGDRRPGMGPAAPQLTANPGLYLNN